MHQPSQPPTDSPPPREPQDAKGKLTGRQAYNIVSDVGAGVNVRVRDNLFQLIAIVVCTPLGVLVGYLVSRRDPGLGMIAGGLFGLLAGLFGSGIALMIYRAVRHAGGKHD